MYLKYLLMGVLLIIFCRLDAQKPNQPQFNYNQSWKEVEVLEKKGLPASALRIIDKIYTAAKAEKNSAQFVKAIIFRIKLNELKEEESPNKNVELLESEIKTADFPVKPLLHSMLAEVYWRYYENNRYRFTQRTETVNFSVKDISTWSLDQIVEHTIDNYQLSLQDEKKLKKTPIGLFEEILISGNKLGKSFRPSLYDLLAHRALDFYTNNEPDLLKPAYSFTINSPDYFREASEFAEINVITRDTFAYKYYALKILQDLIRFHMKDQAPDALIDVNLKRLGFVHLYSILPNKDDLYLAALQKLEDKYRSFPASTSISFQMAQLWNQKADLYIPLQMEEHKWDRKKAFDICAEAIKRFPESRGALQAYNLQQEIKLKSIAASVERVNVPGEPFRALVTYRNFQNLYWRIIPVTREEIILERQKWEKNYDVDQEQMFIQYLTTKAPAKTGKVVLPLDSDFQQHSVELKLDAVSVGSYIILFSNNESFTTKGNGMAYAFTTISNLSYFHRNCDDGTTDIFVVNRTTGEPISNANAQLFHPFYNEKTNKNEIKTGEKYISDAEGYIKIPYNKKNEMSFYRAFEIEFSYEKDTISTFDLDINNRYYYGKFNPNWPKEPSWNEQTLFFLDRAIYRPGQTLYYKGLLTKSDGKNPQIIPNRKLTISFFDVNSQQVAQQQVTTNEYGTFSGSFTTPSSGLMGQMSLRSSDNNSSQTYFSVEEYKRPKFEVKFEPVKGSYKFGETVNVKGKALAYSGANIDGAAVQYRVVRQVVYPFWLSRWYGFPPTPDMEITNGTSVTKPDGSFEIDFTAVPDESVSKTSSPTFIFQVTADVTDINGETHSSSVSVNMAYKALILQVNVRDIDKSIRDSLSRNFEIKTTNLAGEFEPAAGTITVWKLKTPAKAYRERFWQQPDTFLYSEEAFHKLFPNDLYKDENNFIKWPKDKEVLSNRFDTSKDSLLNIAKLDQWDAGKYVLEIESRDKFGEEVKELAYFDVTDNSSGSPVVPAVFAVKEIKASGEPGEKALILAGSSEKVKYLYEIEQDGKILEKQWGNFENQQKVFEIPLKEEYRGNIAIHLVTIKNNRMYSNTQVITVPFTNKQLDIKFETFRDKLMPGQEEQWKIKISSKNADKAMAEMVASLYDASLDAFVPHQWYAQFYNSIYSRLRWQSMNGFGSRLFQEYINNWNSYKFKTAIQPRFFQLNWFYEAIEREEPQFFMVEESTSFDKSNIKKSARLKKSERFAAPMVVDSFDEVLTIASDEDVYEAAPVKSEGKEQDFTDVKVRKNFNETAFFYPHLQTNEQGEIIINFTIPEALTRWKMLGFAHTTDLKFGLIQKELVTQKDLMVVPNQPRFFRENDKMIFQAKVNSMTDKDLEGQARLEFFDALTMQSVDQQLKNTDNLRNFTIKSRQSTNLEWSIEIPEGLQAISYRIVAKSGNFSDGEEMILPVVTNRVLVTESLPLSIRGKQTKEFRFDKLADNTSTTLKHQRYTLEFTSNPAWYAVQALPYLMEFPHECTEQLFSRFYANSIASHIANSNPAIKRVFDTWSTIQPDALLSNLEKNPELKTAMLQETPWVLNAKSESQRKRNIALLFDLNKMAGEQEKALDKIVEAQLENGGFPWFPGLPEDRYITQYIVAGIGHLDVMGVKSMSNKEKVTDMLNRAIAWMDSKMLDRYNFLKAEAKKGNMKLEDDHIAYYEIQYLYARSYFSYIPVNAAYIEAYNYWIDQSKKYWLKQNLYCQGMIALALKRHGETQVTADIIKSLKERALTSEEMGMYWKLDRGYYWYQAPVETQALMIEVFDEVAGDVQAVEDLKVGLLKQKQTQDWRTTKATSEACYALLRRGTDILASNKLPEITIGGEKVDPAKREDTKVEAGTGYFKTAWTASEINPEMGNIKVKKTDESVAWGAVYWQYFEQLDKITTAETPLKLSKKLFKQLNTERGPVITPITDTTPLRTGDLVKVRIELRADRTMEYIHLKDMRASAFEPVETLSGFKYQDGLWYYQSPGDMATNFFIGYLPKGTYVFEYSLRVSQVGDFSNGITTIQCMYAPEFSSHSEGVRVKVR